MAKDIRIGDRMVGPDHPCYIVAEAGVNHNGDLDTALKLVEVAADANADAVKFQKRTTNDILIREALDAPYVKESSYGATYGEHRAALEFGAAEYDLIKQKTEELGITLLASAWDPKSVDFLVELGVPAIKTASADLTNLPLLECAARTRLPMLVSTGMADMNEVREALETIRPLNDQIVLLQCTSSYPANNDELNLRVMETYRREFDVLVGYSGHERGLAPSEAAVALGADTVERHFTLDRTMRGPDHAASLEPGGLRLLVRNIRNVEAALGSPVKRLLECERPVRERLAKSIAAARDIPRGRAISRDDLTVKGPGDGLLPRHIPDLIGVVAERDIVGDTLIPLEAIEWMKS